MARSVNPFPGMNPYLEKPWGDVHQRLVLYGADQVQDQLPKDLRARVEERVFVSGEEKPRPIYPDVRVLERPGPGVDQNGTAHGGLAVAEPLVVQVTEEPQTESILEITEIGSEHRVITVIEVLSPSNKFPGAGQDLYLQKQTELRRGRVNLVEIDLLRSGKRIAAIPPVMVPPDYRTPYRVCVTRGHQQTKHEIYALPLRQRLPIIRIPLRQTDKDVTLDLQALIDLAYKNGGYDDIDYRQPAEPPLENDDAAWADELLRAKNLR